MVKEYFLGASYLLRGLKLALRPGVFLFALIPFLLNVVLFAGVTWGVFSYTGMLNDAVMASIPEGFHWLSGIIWLLVTVAVILVVYFLFTPVANILCAPFNGPLAERAERALTSPSSPVSPFTWSGALQDAKQAVKAELTKLLYMIKFGLPLLVLFVIPVVQLIAPLLWFIFSAWMLAVQYLDYPMGNHGIFFKEQRQRIAQKRSVSLGFGSATALLTMIPGVNFAAVPVAVVAATLLWVEQFKRDKITDAQNAANV